MNKIIYILIVLATVFILSCQKQPVVKTTAIAPLDGEWTVKVYDMATNAPINASIYTIYTSNTANNDKDILLLRATLNGNATTNNATTGAPILGKVKCSVADKTFSITDGLLLNTGTGIVAPNNMFSVSGGKVLLNAAHPPSGTTADSIVFFIDKRGASTTQYRVSGFRRTAWPEDVKW